MKIETLKTAQLTLDPNNARKHSDKSIEAVADSLRVFGLQKPIVIDSKNMVVAGNGTLQAALMLGWDSIQAVRIPDDWSPEMVTAFAIADNRTAELSEWDKQVLSEQVLTLEEEDFALEWLGVTPEIYKEEKVLDEFPSFGEDSETSHKCPRCDYEWNGATK